MFVQPGVILMLLGGITIFRLLFQENINKSIFRRNVDKFRQHSFLFENLRCSGRRDQCLVSHIHWVVCAQQDKVTIPVGEKWAFSPQPPVEGVARCNGNGRGYHSNGSGHPTNGPSSLGNVSDWCLVP